MDTEKAVAVP